MTSDYAVSGDRGDQLHLPGLGPRAGERYVNRHTGHIATVVTVRKRWYVWVTLRSNGLEHEVPLRTFEDNWRRL